MDESIQLDKQCQSSLEIFKVKSYVNTNITGVELCKQKIANKTYIGYLDPFIQSTIESNFCPDLKAQLQDKGIVISELKKLIEKLKGKSVDTKFEKSSVIRQPNAFKIQRPSVLGKPTSFSNSFEVEDQRRNVKLSKNKTSVTACNDSLNAKTLNVKYVSAMCDKCVLIDKHDMCVLNSVAKSIKRTVALESNKKPKNFTRKLYERVSKTCCWWYSKFTPSGYKWKPKSRKENVNPNVSMPLGNASRTANLIEIVLFIVDSGCSKHMTGNLKLLINFVEKFLGTVYYVEGLNHNLFSVGQFCDADLEVAFRKSTCYIRDLKGNDLLTVIPRHEKTPYHIINDRKPSVKFFHIFCSICYIVRDGENLDKMKEKGDESIFVGYSTQSRAYRVFNKRTRVIMESIHVNFNELPQTASDQISSDPAPERQTMALNHDSLSPPIQRQANAPQADRTVTTSNELDLLFSMMFDELLNGSSKIVSKPFAVSATDVPNQCQQHTNPLNNHTTPAPSCQVPTLAPTVISSENINQAETYAENDQVTDDEFINIFSTPIQDQGETSSCHVDSSNMHTFYQ
nr:hypothetical protein [Tanacetum cinerariifolium]